MDRTTVGGRSVRRYWDDLAAWERLPEGAESSPLGPIIRLVDRDEHHSVERGQVEIAPYDAVRVVVVGGSKVWHGEAYDTQPTAPGGDDPTQEIGVFLEDVVVDRILVREILTEQDPRGAREGGEHVDVVNDLSVEGIEKNGLTAPVEKAQDFSHIPF
jgi:hypothetical protein